MAEPSPTDLAGLTLIEREVQALRLLEQLADERHRAETETERVFFRRREEEQALHASLRHRLTEQARAETSDVKTKYRHAREEAIRSADADVKALEAEYAEAKRKAASKAQTAKNAAKKKHEESRWQALALFEAGKDGAIKQFKEHEKQIGEAAEDLEELKFLAAPALGRARRFAPPGGGGQLEPSEPDPIPALNAALTRAEQQLAPVSKLLLPKLLAPSAFGWPFLALAGGLSYPLGTALGWKAGPAVAAGIAIGSAVGAYLGLARVARRRVGQTLPPLLESLAQAERLVPICQEWAKATLEESKLQTENRRLEEYAKSDAVLALVTEGIDRKAQEELAQAEAKYPALIAEVAESREATLKKADDFFPAKLDAIQQRFQGEMTGIDSARAAQVEATEQLYNEAWESVVRHWREGLAEVARIAGSVRAEADSLFLDWNQPGLDLDQWAPPESVPTGLRFGTHALDLDDIPNGQSHDVRLADQGPTRHELPALVPFPQRGSVLIKAGDANGKAEAVKLLQVLMLRYLTSLPAGKVRFTIVDPVGLGENFAAFMHLADYNELLVTSRIWTETPHIEAKLGDLSAHMENVIQKYLRNEFETIEEYNRHAGEVAEPFRVLVVANFPTNFSESAARRLLSIASTGGRCGVYVLASLDTKLALPTGVQLKDLEALCVNFQWRDGKLAWKNEALGRLPLVYDVPPDAERYSRLMHRSGELAKNANRVEVPFDFIAPSPQQYWTSSTSAGVDVPLGRAGATKLQNLKLGKGTSQHVLIAGKTGSGKSTLLHALVTNAALRYSPDELELYLIDFKKGVEFKVYAVLELPHARVIAVESEREFGLSVLQRLDAELKARGDIYRDLGVQDLNGYREATGNKPAMPRVLFIVDEFQEFFVEDDKIAQEVALLLDRLVRQGRAFGIHVILGSQSLGGAYSLARSTLGQMAVRVALQCSESDAHLILSEENSAARLLTRPGEAIYNDANGLVEGNNFFQVVWLSDDRREDYLRQIRELAQARHRPPAQQIVFEGNLPALPEKNHLLAGLLEAEDWGETPKADTAWLGEAIAIKDPTAAIFRPQSGSNLLIVGQNDAMALGSIAVALASLAAQRDPNGLRVILLDGAPADSPMAGRLAAIGAALPHEAREVTARNLAAVLAETAAEIERRQKDVSADDPAIYLVVFDVQRFRDLRKQEDDFGFSRYGEEEKTVPPSKLFGDILREGPPVGVHAIVWCDSLNNLNRTFDRQGLREFELRVLFQMSANDSSTLIDAPTASKLGPNRALFFSEEEGRIEKFRPYGLPTEAWLGDVRKRLAARPMPEPRPTPPPPSSAAAEPEPTTDPMSDPSPETRDGNGHPHDEEERAVDHLNSE